MLGPGSGVAADFSGYFGTLGDYGLNNVILVRSIDVDFDDESNAAR